MEVNLSPAGRIPAGRPINKPIPQGCGRQLANPTNLVAKCDGSKVHAPIPRPFFGTPGTPCTHDMGYDYDSLGKLSHRLGLAPKGQPHESPGQRPGYPIAQRKSPERARQTLPKFRYSQPRNTPWNGELSDGNTRKISSPFQGFFRDGRATQGAALGCDGAAPLGRQWLHG